MHTLRRAAGITALVAMLYATLSWIIGPTRLANGFVTLTAIDHWHPNWPDPTTVENTAQLLPNLALALGVVAAAAYILLVRFGPRLRPTTPGALSSHAVAIGGGALAAMTLRSPTPEQFHAQLCDALRDTGISPDRALEATDAAMALADTDDPADWAGRVRAEAMDLAGLSGTFLRIHSREPRLDDTARFLTDYGYRALRVTRAGGLDKGDGHEMNFDGLAIQYRTEAHAAEEALIELLIVTHQAHLASLADNGDRANDGQVERHAQALRRVATKLALRGFVPPELDAEVGRDGIATAEELEQWAIAQVVAACSPMTRMPLPTIERTIGGPQ